MAKNWNDAQEKEKRYWHDIYISKKKDDIYRPSNEDDYKSFAIEILLRNNLSLEDLNNKVIIDLGSGPGGVAKGLHVLMQEKKIKNSKIIAIDPLMDFYKNQIKLMKEDENLKLVNSTAEELNLPDDFADIIFCTNVIDHCHDPEETIKQCARILRKQGNFYPSLHLAYSAYKPILGFLKYIDTNHPHHFDKSKIMVLLKKYFDKAESINNFSIKHDQKDFNFSFIFKSKDKIRAIKRFMSHYVLYTSYFQCVKN